MCPWTNQPTFLTRGTHDPTSATLCKGSLQESSNAGKNGRKEKNSRSHMVDSVIVVMKSVWEDLKNRVRTDQHGENLSMWLIRVNAYLIVHTLISNLSIYPSILVLVSFW